VNPAAAFWDRGIEAVPATTGAGHVLAANDVRELAGIFGLALPFGAVLDVGCGTGRLAPLCRSYCGVDISADAVAFCRRASLDVTRIDGTADLPAYSFDLITALSVFTHISPEDRLAYLAAFIRRSSALIVDILPGPDSGDIAAWTTPPDVFEALLDYVGWRVLGVHQKTSPQGFTHRYYHAGAA
jgi:SAM-dependent methyltransferase